jgi:hypothetical protein
MADHIDENALALPYPNSPAQAGAIFFLQSLLGKRLRVHATDGRIFVGQMKCTDPVGCPPPTYISLDPSKGTRHGSFPISLEAHKKGTRPQECNIILSSTVEFRPPTTPSLPPPAANPRHDPTDSFPGLVSRGVGLIVVPGRHVTKIEVEEFASQLRGARQQQQQQRGGPAMAAAASRYGELPMQQPFDFGDVV